MESSDEDDIIENNEDEYGEFIEKTKYSVNAEKEDKEKSIDNINNNKNLPTETDEFIIKKERKNNVNNIINNNNNKKDSQRIKRNLIIVNKVIELNINQNKKYIKELKQKDLGKKENKINNKNFHNENNRKIIINTIEEKKDEEKIQKEIEYTPTKVFKFEIISNKKRDNSENKIMRNIKDVKIDNKNENNLVDNKDDSNKNKEEKGEELEGIKNKIIKEEKLGQNNQKIRKGILGKNKEYIIEQDNIDNDLINKSNKMENNEQIKNKEVLENDNQSKNNFIREDEKISEINKNDSVFIQKDNYEKDKEESVFIKDKIELEKNFIIQSNEKEKSKINNDTYFLESNKEKSINLDLLKSNEKEEEQNIVKSRNKMETIQKIMPKNNNIKKNENMKFKESIFSESAKPNKRIGQQIINKINIKKNMSINTNQNQKENYFSANSFHNLLGCKTFRKFLNQKLEQSKNNNDEIPKKFIENLSIKLDEPNIIINKEKKPSNINDSISNFNYSLLYNEDNYKIPLSNKNYRMTYATPQVNNIKIKFKDRYKKDISVPQYDNLNESIGKIESHRFTTTGYPNFNENISDLTLKNQKLHDKIIELQNQIRISKNEVNLKNSELQKYFSSYDKMTLENNLNKEKIDELKRELKMQKGEMNKKQNKISELENINNNLKNEMTKLQKNYDAETTMIKETKQNYDLIKSNYNDIKNQYDLLNIKYQTLTDENFNFKRDKALYERQIKTKNQMIESLIENKSNLLNNKLYQLDMIEDKEESNHEMFLDYLKNKNLPREIPKKEEKDNGMKKNKDEKNGNDDYKVDINYSKFDKLTYPELQSKRDELVNERKNINSIFSKIPLKSSYKGQLEKKNELEKKLNDINCDLAIIKLRMKKLKS